MRPYSPDWVCEEILGARARLEAGIAAKLGEPAVRWLAPGFLLLFFAACLWHDAGIPEELKHTSMHRLLDGSPAVATLALLAYFVSLALGPAYLTAVIAAAGALAIVVVAAANERANVAAICGIVLASRVALHLLFRCSRGWKPAWRVVAAVATCLAFFNLMIFLDNGWHEFFWLDHYRPNRMLFLILLPLLEPAIRGGAEQGALFGRQLWFPLQLIYPVPTRLQQWSLSPERAKVQVRGLLDVLIGMGFLVIHSYMSKVPLAKNDLDGFSEFLGFGLHCYVETYFLSCGSISVPIGLARIWGFSLPDPYSLPLLAASPFDRWRRWNSYFYHFYRWAVFLPLARKFESLFVAVMGTFVITILFHVGGASPITVHRFEEYYLAGNIAAFFLAHGLVVYLGLKLNLPVFRGAERKGWGGVALTWALMVLVHILNRWTL